MLRTTYTMNFRQPIEDESPVLPSSPTRANKLKQQKSSSSRRKLTAIAPMMSDALMEVVGRSKSKRSLSPKLRQCSAKNLKVGLNQIKTMVGQVISVEKPAPTTRAPRKERPFCSSSITLPDFDQESLILSQHDRFCTGSSEQEMSSSFQNHARISTSTSSSAIPPPPPSEGLYRQTTTDSQPSQPKRRSSTSISLSGSASGVGVPSMPRRRSSRTAATAVVVGGNQPSLPLRRSSSPIAEEEDTNKWLASLSDQEEEEED